LIMTTPHRLFDCIDDLLQKSPNAPLFSAKENGAWKAYSVTEVADIVEKLAAGLLALGVYPGDMTVEGRDKVAVLSRNRPEWLFLDLAVQKIGAVLVPVYPTVHVQDLQFVLNDARVKFVFVNDAELFGKVQSVLADCPSVQGVYSFEQVGGSRYWKEVLSLGRQEHFQQIEVNAARIDTEDLATIIYTSGTTGTPKGVMLSHHNILSNVMSILPEFNVDRGSRVISFLPLNHIFEKTVSYFYMFAGCHIHYAESLETLGDNIRETKPEMFSTVPRLLEKVFEKIMAKGEALTGTKRKLFFWAVRLAEKYEINQPQPLGYRIQLAIANKLIFSKWREALGGSLRWIVTGAAACQVKLIRIFTAAGIPILEGYGQTESSPVISFNRVPEKDRMFGTVGPVIDGVTVKIAEDGEILCKGPNVMMGYYKRPDQTLETVKDGWLYTGDIGTMVDGKYLKITDRKKEIFKTSGGKFVAPQPIENKMAESPYIDQVMVIGAGEKFAAALVVPSFNKLREWCKDQEIDAATNESIIRHPRVLEQIGSVIQEMNRHFNHVEQIKKFELLPCEWTVDGGR
jgi:long-chain acyl-CoA synthetase